VKLYAYSLAVNYFEAYGLFAANGIFFNYESPLRSAQFVARKITSGVAAFIVHDQYQLRLGNLSAERNCWGSAREYVDGMWRIPQAPSPEAFVLATGRTETITTFVNKAYATQGIELEWEGSRIDERAQCRKAGKPS
jgi:GDPmannose 4,6-dehydratase